jgi:putative Mg2+ transporter-C (MgtC) family protein
MPDLNVLIVRVLLAIIAGGIIGAEREYRNKSAGFRTMILISAGSCLFTIFSMAIGTANPDRIASNIVTGIGFIGAGVIFKTDDRVKGLTTAAVIWLTAAMGMGIGAGYYLFSFIGCGIALLVLVLFMFLEGWIDKANQIRTYNVVCNFKHGQIGHFEKLFRQHHLKFKRVKQGRNGLELSGTWIVQGKEINHDSLTHVLLNDNNIIRFEN